MKSGCELMQEVERLKENRDMVCADNAALIEKIDKLTKELSDADEVIDTMNTLSDELEQEIDALKEDKKQLEIICWVREAERNEARKGAKFYRDLYVGIVGKTYDDEYRLPWEAGK